jgi:hypothetical protein
MFEHVKTFNLEHPLSAFFSLTKKDKRICLYYRVIPYKNHPRKITRGYGGIQTFCSKFDKEKGLIDTEVILDKNGICHNFSIFKGANKEILGFGGWEDYRHNGIISKEDNYKEGREKLLKFYYKDFKISKERFDNIKSELSEYIPYSDGMYILKNTKNNIFEPITNKPIIDIYSDGYIHNIGWKISNFDGFNNVLFDGENYHVYLRANISLGVRHIQHAVYDTKWNMIEPFSLINFDINFDNKNDEYYLTNFMQHPFKENVYFGLLPYINKKQKKSTIRLFLSKNKKDWVYKKDYLEVKLKKPSIRNPNNMKAYYHPVQGYYIEKNFIYFLFHGNYYKMNGLDKPSTIGLFRVPVKEFNKEVIFV